jgi:hypothetical protein
MLAGASIIVEGGSGGLSVTKLEMGVSVAFPHSASSIVVAQ